MDLKIPACNHPECQITLQERPAMARRGPRTVPYLARVWCCATCADPDTGSPPLEFIDAQLVAINDEALRRAWFEKYSDEVPASGRPGRRTDEPKTERVAILLTAEDMERVDASRGSRSRSEFLRDVISERLQRQTA
jgi:hypothetical protein